MRPFPLTCCIIAIAVFCLAKAGLAESNPLRSPDLTKHPLYSTYDFGKGSKIVNFGVQPIAVPIGLIGEVMKRDRILKRALKERGWDIRFHAFLKGSDLNFFVRRGSIDGAMAGDMPVIMTASSFDIVIAALAKQGFISIISSKHMQVEELKNKRIGFPAGTTAHYGLLLALLSGGLKESDIIPVHLEVNELYSALEQGRIDAFSAWEPFVTAALFKNKDLTVIQRVLSSSYFYFSGAFAKKNPEAAELIAASFVRSLQWIKNKEKNLLRAARWAVNARENMTEKTPELSLERIAAITKEDLLKIASSPVIPKRDYAVNGFLHRLFDSLQKQGIIAQNANWGKVFKSFDREIIEKVLADPVKYRLLDFDYGH